MPQLNRRQLLRSALAAPAVPLVRAAQTRRPNVVLILTDDQGWYEIAINGNRDITRPTWTGWPPMAFASPTSMRLPCVHPRARR